MLKKCTSILYSNYVLKHYFFIILNGNNLDILGSVILNTWLRMSQSFQFFFFKCVPFTFSFSLNKVHLRNFLIHLKQTGFCQTTTHTTPSKGIWGKPSTSQPVLLQNLPLLLFMNIYVTGAAIYLSLSMFYNRCCCVFVFSSFSRPLWPELLQADGQSYCRVVLSPF